MKDNLEAVAVSAMAFRLDDLVVGAPDPRGRMVLDILWAVDAFKIYKTSEGLTPFFSDNPKMAVAQRSAYLELGSEISEYNHLIHALRPPVLPFTDGKRAISERDTHTVEHFERELARCIAQAMLGDVPQARVALRRLRRRLGAQISNRGRIVHLCVNLVLVAILVATGLILVRIDYVSPLGYDTREVFTAVMMGGVGALFSTTVRGIGQFRCDGRVSDCVADICVDFSRVFRTSGAEPVGQSGQQRHGVGHRRRRGCRSVAATAASQGSGRGRAQTENHNRLIATLVPVEFWPDLA
jgi:hypothetical protein